MASVYNQKLKKLVSKTAVVHTGIPVIVCDCNLRVCQMSCGAAQRFADMRIGTDFSVCIPESCDLSDGSYAVLMIGRNSYPVLIAAGCIDADTYTAFIFESSYIEFTDEPAYVSGARIALVDRLKELLGDPSSADHRFGRQYKQLEHLKSCGMQSGLYYLNQTVQNIGDSLDYIMKQCEDQLETVGCSVMKRIHTDAFTSFVCNRQYFNTMLPMLMAAGIAVSRNGQLEIFCEKHEGSNTAKAVKFGIATKCSDDCSLTIHDLQELIEREPPVALELSAADCMLEAIGKRLEFACEGDTAKIYFVIEAGTSDIIELHSDSLDRTDPVRRLMHELLEIFGLIGR